MVEKEIMNEVALAQIEAVEVAKKQGIDVSENEFTYILNLTVMAKP